MGKTKLLRVDQDFAEEMILKECKRLGMSVADYTRMVRANSLGFFPKGKKRRLIELNSDDDLVRLFR